MKLNKKPYKGTRDFFPADMQIREYLFEKMRSAAHEFGFLPYDGPMIEEVELYKAKSGEELINDQIYSFVDRGDRLVAIRPEMTPTLARMVAQVHKEMAKPLKWYSIPNLMRYEKPQRGRLREHWQFNVDIFGAPDNLGEIEILSLAISLMKKLGANDTHFEILINDRQFVESFFTHVLKLNSAEQLSLYKVIDKAKKINSEKLNKLLADILDEKQIEKFKSYLEIKDFDALKDFINQYNLTEYVQTFLGFIARAESLNLTRYLRYDPTIVRGLDYYTGIVFEIFDKNPENRRAICGGGAYANLLQIFNESPLPGVGFGLGDVTLKDFLETHNLLPKLDERSAEIYFTYQDDTCEENAFKTAEKLRGLGLNIELNLGSLKFKKVFNIAQKKGFDWVILFGTQEMEKKTLTLKNAENQESFDINLNDLEQVLLKVRG